MIKCFLSHSSADKKKYIDIVARKMDKENIIYDAYTFEEGRENLEEIMSGLNQSDLFVVFISNDSLNSKWVQREILEAKNLHEKGYLKKIYPILIDNTINYKDERLPDWMRENYNIRPLVRPSVAFRRIKQRMREISWDFHPRLREKEQIFVGRNELISSFEERIDDFNREKPSCIIAGGLEAIGRRTFLKKAFQKTNIIDRSYEFSVMSFQQQDSMEDFIFKLYDFGFSEEMDLAGFLTKTVNEKVEIASKLIFDLQEVKERVLIIDNGCIVGYDRQLAGWFLEILKKIEKKEIITFAIASKYRLRADKIRGLDSVFAIDIPEMDLKERSGLFVRCVEFEKLHLSKEDLNFFSGLLNGFPQQVFFAVSQVKDLGIEKAKRESHEIIEYSSEKANKILKKYEDDPKKMDFLSFLAHFDFISYDFIFDIVEDTEFYENFLEELITNAVCEEMGSNREYVRVNDALRDYLTRNRFKIPEVYADRLKNHVEKFVANYKNEELDITDFFYSMKEALLSGQEIDEKYLIPSHFLKTMKELYDQYNRYDDVIKLADRVLEKEKFLDEKISGNVRYYLCLSLARKRSDRLLREVQLIKGPEHNFLLGFYYRLKGRYSDAIDRLQRALGEKESFSRARRELVQVYNYIEDFQSALELAKVNYELGKTNPFHIQAYFHCVLKSSRPFENQKLLRELLGNLEKIKTDLAQEMHMRAKAEFYAFNQNDEGTALGIISDSIAMHPKDIYPLFTKFDICEKFKNIVGMKSTISELEERIDEKSYFYNALLKSKCLLIAYTDEKEVAMAFLNNKLKDFPLTSRDKIRQKIEIICNS